MNQAPVAGFLPLVFVFIVFYFLLIRPQQKKAKQHADFLANLTSGKNVILTSGIVGKIIEVKKEDNIVAIEISNGVSIKILKDSILSYKD
jgi:preprotein translocase subunit YajC